MGQYKVLQDIEAEDKLLGPLSLRQFIYAAVTVALGFIAFQLFAGGLWFIGIFFVPPMLFFGLLAAPFGHEQSSEIWMLAKVRFWVFPRKRIWDQSGIQNLVTITVPKKEEKQLTKDFDKEEAKSRLKALASTLDSRGWAVKNVVSSSPVATNLPTEGSDRLIDIQSYPEKDPSLVDVRPSDDLLDDTTNPTAMQMGQRLNQSTQKHKQELMQKMQQISQSQQQSANTGHQPAVQKTSSETKANNAKQQQQKPINQQSNKLNQNAAPQRQLSNQPSVNSAKQDSEHKQQTNNSVINNSPQTSQQNVPQQNTANKTTQTMTDNHKPDTIKGVKEDVENSQKTSMNVAHDNDSSNDSEVVVSLH